MADIDAMNELRLLCNDNGIEVADVEPIRSCARKFGVPVVAAYRRAKDLGMLTYQQTMTAPNNPTPEVEPTGLIAATRSAADEGVSISSQTVLYILDHFATTISRLTAERNYWKDLAAHHMEIRLREEKRAEELERELARITAIGEDNFKKLMSYIDITPKLESANKLLSERIAGLERICPRCGTESLATVLQWRKEGMTLEAIAESVGITKGAVWQAIRKGDLRRARSSLEVK